MSTLVAQTISNGTVSTSSENVIQGSAKAWVNFNGTGTVAIRGSYNVSSITDNGTGDYTVNFTNAFADANYVVTTSAGDSSSSNVDSINPSSATAPTTSSVRIIAVRSAIGAYDLVRASVAVFR
jgi:hypothetical protein